MSPSNWWNGWRERLTQAHEDGRGPELITCIVPHGRALPVIKALKEELGIVSTTIHHARGTGRMTPLAWRGVGESAEKDVLTAVVPASRAEEVFASYTNVARSASLTAGFFINDDWLRAVSFTSQTCPMRAHRRVDPMASTGPIRLADGMAPLEIAVMPPTYFGGLRLASELIRPTVVSFLDVMLRDRDANLRIDEFTIPASSPAAGKTVGEFALDEISSALLLAVRSSSGEWHYNPRQDQRVTAGTVLILLGSPEDMRSVCDQLGGVVVSKPAISGA